MSKNDFQLKALFDFLRNNLKLEKFQQYKDYDDWKFQNNIKGEPTQISLGYSFAKKEEKEFFDKLSEEEKKEFKGLFGTLDTPN
jgi:hypothetical protein